MSESTVKEIMTEFVQSIPTGSTVMEATQLMSKGGIGSIIIMEKDNPTGILT
jgi:predicted transcriptional regulator